VDSGAVFAVVAVHVTEPAARLAADASRLLVERAHQDQPDQAKGESPQRPAESKEGANPFV
jgi:hypothetical protein